MTPGNKAPNLKRLKKGEGNKVYQYELTNEYDSSGHLRWER